MTVVAFEGPAGSGKTHRLMEEVGAALQRRPLQTHQRVLALTFMHGSRRRLDARLRGVAGIANRFEATTVDSLAWRLVQRWHVLARHLGHTVPLESAFDATCALAAALLENPVVRAWVNLSFPHIVVDEAQDLSTSRSAMIAAQAMSSNILLAYDEFQCLDPQLLPVAIGTWLPAHCASISLTGCQRTSDAELIAAARAIRAGRAPSLTGRKFKIVATPGRPELAAAYLANAIAWRGGGNMAVLTPSRQGGFAENAVRLVRAGPVGRHHNGGYDIRWENRDGQEAADLWDTLALSGECTVAQALEALAPHRHTPLMRNLHRWALHRQSVSGPDVVTVSALRQQLDRALQLQRRHGHAADALFSAMTITQAKNREFDHVVVLWPYNVRNDPELKRRLLYNAITRAKRSCTVLVQSAELLRAPPFSVGA